MHSFVSGNVVDKLSLRGSRVKEALIIVTPGGKIPSHTVAFGVPVQLGSNRIQSNLVVIGFEGMDVILGMDWMTRHKVVLDISGTVIAINSPTVGHTTLYLPFKDGNYALVLEVEEGGAGTELQYVEVIEDTEGTQANPTDEGKPWCINLSILKIYATTYE
jgi:hypothetical protein